MRLRTSTLLIIAVCIAVCQETPRPTGATSPPFPPQVDEKRMLSLNGFGDLSDHIQAAMGTAAERADRAPYSPEGWPWERGDLIPLDWYMNNPFGNWQGVSSPFWIGKTVFGALKWSYFVGQSEGDSKVDSDSLESPR